MCAVSTPRVSIPMFWRSRLLKLRIKRAAPASSTMLIAICPHEARRGKGVPAGVRRPYGQCRGARPLQRRQRSKQSSADDGDHHEIKRCADPGEHVRETELPPVRSKRTGAEESPPRPTQRQFPPSTARKFPSASDAPVASARAQHRPHGEFAFPLRRPRHQQAGHVGQEISSTAHTAPAEPRRRRTSCICRSRIDRTRKCTSLRTAAGRLSEK